MDVRTDYFSSSKSLHSGRLQLPSPPLGLKRFFRSPWEEVFDRVIFSDLLPFNDQDIPTLLHHSSASHSSLDISCAPSSLAPSCSWEVLQDLSSDHLPILLSVPLSPVFRPYKRPPSIFRKLTEITLPSTLTRTVFLQRNTRLFLFPLLLLLTLLLWH